jgi:predicted lipoprotein with Yx(FWY)xxD motif
LLVAAGAVHLDLYLTGYASIPAIGPLFLVQVIAAACVAAAVLATGSRVAAGVGAMLAAGALGGYLWALWIGLFGFREVRTGSGVVAGMIEVGAFWALAVHALRPGAAPAGQPSHGTGLLDRTRARMPGAGRPVAAVSILAAALLGISVAATTPPAFGAAGTLLKVQRIGSTVVLTNSRGYTMYWFARDTATQSNCNGSCTEHWPPATGSSAAGPGVTGEVGTIIRSDGLTQTTYDGHPLYAYAGDSAPGQDNGNGLILDGGVWRQISPAS